MANSNRVKAKDLTPAYATHPGEILLDELEYRKINQNEFAKTLGVQKSQLNEIIKGKRSVNAEIATLLEAALSIPANFWLNAQANFDLALVKIQSKVKERTAAIAAWKMMEGYVAAKFFKSLNLLSGDPIEDISTVKRIYNIDSLDQLALTATEPTFCRFRKSTKLSEDKINTIGWVKYVEYQASLVKAPVFDSKGLDELISSIRQEILLNNNLKEKIKELLFNRGIILVYQNKADQVPVDGYSYWLGDNPVIGMSLRHNRIDNFAFTLFHELGHVFLHLNNNKDTSFLDLENDDSEYKNSKEEKEADLFAQEKLIPKKDWLSFWDGKEAFYHVNKILKFSDKIKIHPAIVRGRLCHELEKFNIPKSTIDYTLR